MPGSSSLPPVVSYEGSLLFMERAPSQNKVLCDIDGGLHDMLCNEPGQLASHILEFVRRGPT